VVTDQATKQGPKYPIILERIFSPDYVFVSFKKSKKKTFLELIGCQETPPPLQMKSQQPMESQSDMIATKHVSVYKWLN
jgi:hypothetical protein